ncbi:MAG TPA: response regulator transcription factor [Acidimicrobiia bacterium]|nr:response regulator transcription factor [Acidimicrobiia bacterium]
MRILLVEDDRKMAAAMHRGLQTAGMVVDVTQSGSDAEWMVHAAEYQALILDVMLPDLDGFELCQRLRTKKVQVPIIMVTARDSVEDRVRGLDVGADDYLVKPFSLAELLARLRALDRRGPQQKPAVLQVGSLRLDPGSRRVWRGDVEVDLTAKEFSLLERFMSHPGQVLSYQSLLDAGWDLGYEHRSNVVEVYIRYLREKIDRPFGVKSLETVRGVGYRLSGDLP